MSALPPITVSTSETTGAGTGAAVTGGTVVCAVGSISITDRALYAMMPVTSEDSTHSLVAP